MSSPKCPQVEILELEEKLEALEAAIKTVLPLVNENPRVRDALKAALEGGEG